VESSHCQGVHAAARGRAARKRAGVGAESSLDTN
jgi:hypothetical protein